MYCLLVFGLVSGFESLFGLLTLFSVLGGRSSTTTLVKSRDSNNIVYESKISLHPFFDGSQGTLGFSKNVKGIKSNAFKKTFDFAMRSRYNIQRLFSSVRQ